MYNVNMKKCARCKIVKSDFRVDKRIKDGLSSWCISCYKEYRKQPIRKEREYQQKTNHRHDNIEHYRKIERNRNLKLKFGITLDDYNKKLSSQNYCCAICGAHEDNLPKKLAVDHDHRTGKIRDLLCHICNVGLGHFNDNILDLEKAISYLRKHSV